MLRRSVLLNIVGQVAMLVIGFVPSVLIARWLGTTDRGLLAVLGTSSSIAFIVSALGIPSAVLYFASAKEPPTRTLLGNSLVVAAAMTVVFVLPAWLLRDQLADLLTHNRGETLWVLAALTIPVTFLDWTTHNQLIGRLRFGLYNALIIGQKVLFLIVALVLVRIIDIDVAGVLIATIAGSLLVIAGSLWAILPEGRPALDRPLFGQLLSYGRRTQLGAIFQFVNSRFDVLILQFFVPLAAVGYYVVAQTLAEMVMVLTRSFQASITSLVTRDADNPAGQAATTSVSMRHHGLLCLGATAINAVFSPILIELAYGPGFRPAIVPFFIVLPGIWFLASGLLVANDLNGRNRPGLASKLSGLAVGVTVTFDLLLIPFFGVTGAAVASLIAYVVFGVASIGAESRVSHLPWRELMPRIEDARAYPRVARGIWTRMRGPASLTTER